MPLTAFPDGVSATTLTVAGADVTSAVNAGGVAGVANGYKLARGTGTLDGANPTPIATGLATVLAAAVSLKGTAAPGASTGVLTVNINGTSIDVYAWKATSTSNPTYIASTGTEEFYWIAVGT